MARVQLTDETIDSLGIMREVETPGYGAVATFAGNVRDNVQGRKVIAIEYTAYRPLAQSELARIAAEAETRCGGAVVIVHRLGPIAIGDATVFIAVATPHRAEAFETCRWIIDTLKTTVPIWKRETYEDGEVWIEGDNTIPVK